MTICQSANYQENGVSISGYFFWIETLPPPESREAQNIHDQLTKTHRLLLRILKAGNNCWEGVHQWSCLRVVHGLQEYGFCVATHAKMDPSGVQLLKAPTLL